MEKVGKEISIQEMRKIQIDILDAIHLFCESNHIRYSLCGGTLLGAVRHKGYIPWDDDIDIFMPRPDYEKFISTFDNGTGNLRVQHYKNDISYPLRWARVFDDRTILISINSVDGVFVDVFPVDGLPDLEGAKQMSKELLVLRDQLARTTKFHSQAVRQNAFLLNVKYYIKKLFCPSRKTVLQKYDKLLHTYEFETSKNAGVIVSRFGEKELLEASVFKSYIQLPFEGKMYSCIKDYDVYLRKLYGDYMQLPPKEKRVTHHRFKIYWKDS